MSAVDFNLWLNDLKSAWIEKSFDKIEDIFSEATEYWEDAFSEPVGDIGRIMNFWKEIGVQENIDLEFFVVMEGDFEGVAEWSLRYIDVSDGAVYEFTGLYYVKFNNRGKCDVFKQWICD